MMSVVARHLLRRCHILNEINQTVEDLRIVRTIYRVLRQQHCLDATCLALPSRLESPFKLRVKRDQVRDDAIEASR